MSPAGEYARALLRKAREDQYVAERLADDLEGPGWVIGFHAQQAVEKALKAVLSAQEVEFPRTHNLAMLTELLRRTGLPLPPDGDDLNRLTPFGVTFRYEDMGEEEVEGDRDWSVRAALRTVEWAEQALEAANSPSEGP